MKAHDKKEIHILQADTIFKALHYVCKHEGIEVDEELEEVFKVLAEINPYDPYETDSYDCEDVMNSLKDFIKEHEFYAEYFESNEEHEED